MKMRQIAGQINLKEYIDQRPRNCCTCVCRSCLYWWSGRCPYGGCWDDYRAETEPYGRAHPDAPLRKGWSHWNEPGERDHWCRGGVFYPVFYCPRFAKYAGQQVQTCLKANVSVFQDGYIACSLIENYGCEKCYEEFMRKEDEPDNRAGSKADM